MNSNESRSVEDLKSQVFAEIDRVNTDLRRLVSRLSPGKMIDDLIFGTRGETPRRSFEHLRANPIGALFLGIGTVLLMEGKDRVSYEKTLREKTRAGVGRMQKSLSQGKGRLHQASGKLHKEVRSLKSRVLKKEHKTGEASLGEGGELGQSSVELQQEGPEQEETRLGEIFSLDSLDPMQVALIGAGVGALIGASLPEPLS